MCRIEVLLRITIRIIFHFDLSIEYGLGLVYLRVRVNYDEKTRLIEVYLLFELKDF